MEIQEGGSLIRQKETQTGLGHHLNIKLCLFNIINITVHAWLVYLLSNLLFETFVFFSQQSREGCA